MMMQGPSATDSQLLDRFVNDHDSASFRSMVNRHGPTVRKICRGVLHDPHEADDAFQATFLLLIRKAGSIPDPNLLGRWLRAVAYRTAARARHHGERRRVIERSRADMAPTSRFPDVLTPETVQIIREELNRLPDSYRQALTLCYMEDLSHQEAAGRLRWPIGTVKARLSRGRQLLRQRLDRRGANFVDCC